MSLDTLLAVIDPFEKLPTGTPGTAPASDSVFGSYAVYILLIAVGLLLLVFILLLWAIYFRKPNLPHTEPLPEVAAALERNPLTKKRSRRRRRHREEEFTFRNPTLSETGGLPPVKKRPEDPQP